SGRAAARASYGAGSRHLRPPPALAGPRHPPGRPSGDGISEGAGGVSMTGTARTKLPQAALPERATTPAVVPPRGAGVNRHDDLSAMLRRLNLGHIADTFTETALAATKAHLSHEAFLYELAAQECAVRAQRRIERHLRESRLPREKTFASLQLDRFSPTLQLHI